jgi:hypothetical protein
MNAGGRGTTSVVTENEEAQFKRNQERKSSLGFEEQSRFLEERHENL